VAGGDELRLGALRDRVGCAGASGALQGPPVSGELAPKYWLATRVRLRPDELAMPICSFKIPPRDVAAATAPAACAGPSAAMHAPARSATWVRRSV